MPSLTITWRSKKDRRLYTTKHKVSTETWNNPKLNRERYCQGVCTVLGGKLVKFKQHGQPSTQGAKHNVDVQHSKRPTDNVRGTG